MKKVFIGLWLTLIVVVIGTLFWYNELIYGLPTPIPAGYKQVKIGKVISLPQLSVKNDGKPVFLHFFNPDCLCSRFNIEEFKALAARYGGAVHFAIVVISKKPISDDYIRHKFNLSIPVLQDASLAQLCGVYSTPQAVLIDDINRLYYRGNYNRGRYCTDDKTNFAKMAIDELLKKNTHPAFSPFAIKAYGCSLPGCRNKKD